MRTRCIAGLSLIATALLCVDLAASDQDLREKIASGGRERSYRVFVPDGFGRSGFGPAVVLFNGSGSAVDGLMDPWKDIARKEGVLLIGPGAFQQGAWRIPEDSPDFTRELVEALEARFPIDPRRVYLAGHSGGAGHVLLLGLLESEYFAAVAAHAGALRQSDAALLDVPQRKIPMAIWIGTKDQMVPLTMARDTLKVLTARGFPAKVTEIPGHSHSYAELAKDVTAQAWAFLQKEALQADPKYYRYPFK